MKINYCISSFWAGGGARTILKIADLLIDRGHEVSITAFAVHPKAVRTRAKIITSSYSLYLMAAGALFQKLSGRPFHNRYYKSWEYIFKNIPDCDINVATDCMSVFPMFLARRGVPFYHSQHYEELFFEDDYLKALAKLTYDLPVNNIVNSIWLQKMVKDIHGRDADVVNPGYDLNVFYPREVKKGGKKRIVCYSNVREWKGFGDALAAMEIVFSRRSDVEWLVYGYHPNKSRSPNAPYRRISTATNKELAELYSSADVVFSPSWYESFPGPPIEAMLCGTPVVTTSIGVEDYAIEGETALIVPPRDPKALAEGILNLLEDPDLCRRLRDNALRKVKEFTWDKTVNKVEGIFRAKLDERKARS